MESIEKKIAEKVNDAGGRVFYVGGFVRDKLLGKDNKDIDIEVHGVEPDTLFEILGRIGEPQSFGKSFGVFALKGYDIDIAMPRREKATGRGHKDFEVFVDPYIGTFDAARRRDFTMNALMEDVLTGEVVDHFGGLDDLKAGIIRHIDPETFIEDPLRVLRAAQFAARFGFSIAPETIELCRGIDLSTLSKERVVEELKKALLKAEKPSIFFESLRAMDQLSVWFPELEQLIQDPKYHPEGDVWVHTMEVIDRAAAYRDKVTEPFRFMLLALTHDLGKIVATEEVKGRIHAYGHEKKGMALVENFVRRLTGEKGVNAYVLNMVPLHMKPNVAAYSQPAMKSTNKMFDQAIEPEDLICKDTMDKPHVMGRDLVAAGFEPAEDFSEILAYAHKLRLAGIDKESALKQTLAYARQLRGIKSGKKDGQ